MTATSLGPVELNFANTTFLKFQVLNTGNNSFPISIDNLELDTDANAVGSPVPEPSSLVLGIVGILALVTCRRR